MFDVYIAGRVIITSEMDRLVQKGALPSRVSYRYALTSVRLFWCHW